MELKGINLDKDFLNSLSKDLNTDILNIERSIYEAAGEKFNIASPKQLGIILFEKLNLVDKPKKTKTGQYKTSEEETMIEVFKNGEDIHASTASRVFNVPIDEVTREQRSNAKTVNFGIIYGVSAFGLSNQIDLSRGEAKELIDTYYETYPS